MALYQDKAGRLLLPDEAEELSGWEKQELKPVEEDDHEGAPC